MDTRASGMLSISSTNKVRNVSPVWDRLTGKGKGALHTLALSRLEFEILSNNGRKIKICM